MEDKKSLNSEKDLQIKNNFYNDFLKEKENFDKLINLMNDNQFSSIQQNYFSFPLTQLNNNITAPHPPKTVEIKSVSQPFQKSNDIPENEDKESEIKNIGLFHEINNVFNTDLNEPFTDIKFENNYIDELFYSLDNINNNPIKDNLFERMPKHIIKDINKLSEDNKTCLICLENYKNLDNTVILPCIHFYHIECIEKWLKKHDFCPLCKFELSYENINKAYNNK